MVKCQYCNKLCNGSRGLSSHERRCPDNPSNMERNGGSSVVESVQAIKSSNFMSDAKEAFINAVTEHGWTFTECKAGRDKYRNIQINCSGDTHGRADMKLSMVEYFTKMHDAGIKPCDIGRNRDKYQLSRVGDEGDYTLDNCYFQTMKENRLEQDMSGRDIDYSFTRTPEARAQRSINAKKQWEEGRFRK